MGKYFKDKKAQLDELGLELQVEKVKLSVIVVKDAPSEKLK